MANNTLQKSYSERKDGQKLIEEKAEAYYLGQIDALADIIISKEELLQSQMKVIESQKQKIASLERESGAGRDYWNQHISDPRINEW